MSKMTIDERLKYWVELLEHWEEKLNEDRQRISDDFYLAWKDHFSRNVEKILSEKRKIRIEESST